MHTSRETEAIRQVLARCQNPDLDLPDGFGPVRMRKILKTIEQMFRDIDAAPPPRFDAEDSHQAIVQEFEAKGNLRGLTARQRRQAPWVYFIPLKDRPVLAKERKYVRALFDLLTHCRRPRETVSLLHRFLLFYPMDWEVGDALRKGIVELLKHPSSRLQGWRDRNEVYGLLKPQGPHVFTEAVLRKDKPIAESLLDAHLKNELEKAGFVEHAYSEMLRLTGFELKQRNPDRAILKKVLDFSEVAGGLRFDSQRADLANNLLEPFHEGDAAPDLRLEIERFMVRNYRHPGINANGWLGVSDKARSVMLRWLVGSTLEDFFHVLDRTASTATAEGNRWQYRKQFWGAYHRKGYIRDAWVALGSSARDLLWRRRGTGLMRYADLQGATPNDCLLLLRIGTLTIAEWSHTGMCRFWKPGNRTAPPFYRSSYYKSEIYESEPNEALSHHGAAIYGWQGRFADYIRAYANTSISLRDYRLP
jgi:hypothetical protein